MDIHYSSNKKDLENLDLTGFFEGWSHLPSNDVLQKSIKNATYVVLAIDTQKKKLAGYITALSDKVLSAYIPFLEVEKSYQKNKIGTTLLKKILEQLDTIYMIDIVCDKELTSFYQKAGFKNWYAMIKRNYLYQAPKNEEK